MDHADIRGRHGGLFRSSAIHGQQSLPTGNSISGISTASTSSGFTRTITGIKRNVAQNLLKDFDSKVDSDSSLSDIGKESASRRSTSRSQATSSSQLAFIPKPNGNTRYYEQSYVTPLM